MGNHKHYKDRKGVKRASREASRRATSLEKQHMERIGAPKGPKARKKREYLLARQGMMNRWDGIYQLIHTFVDNGMRAGYKAGYRLA